MLSCIRKHIAWLLATVFLMTLVPYNALHHHEEDVHYDALIAQEVNHACEFDEHHCEGEFSQSCEHTAHLCASHPNCFSCDFHFIKTFDLVVISTEIGCGFYPIFFTKYKAGRLAGEYTSSQNKDPPMS